MKKQLQKLLSLALLIIAIGASKATAQSNAMHDRANDYKGKWGVRILHATAYDAQNPDGTGVTAENFDVDAFMAQIDQLTTINHVVINLNRGHQASWYSAPYPEKSAEIGEGFFPTRDLFGELLDALNSRDIKALVYLSGVGYDHDYPTAAQNAQWDTYLANNYPIENYTGTTPEKRQRNAAFADIVEYYSLKYGTKIDGWWFDRCYGSEYTVAEKTNLAVVARAGNPNAFFTLHAGTTGSPLQQRAPECDFTAGHPTLMAFQPPWTETSTRSTGVGSDMVEDIEAGPWIDINGKPDASEGTALGAILIPFQQNWRNGAADFPTDLAVDWTSRAMAAGGMYTWAVAREGSGFATSQFNQLIEINTRIEAYLNDPTTFVSKVFVAPEATDVYPGYTKQLSANLISFSADENLIWTSSDNAIATVDSNGLVTAISEGIATITATAELGGLTDSSTVTVIDFPSDFVNIALEGSATQSSINTSFVAEADLAIDGNTSGAFEDGSVTLTGSGVNTWWQVDLGKEYYIDRIRLYARTDECCKSRMSDFTVSVINSAGETTYSQSYESFPDPFFIIDAKNAIGSIIKVQRNASGILSIAEVQVIGNTTLSVETQNITNRLLVYPNPGSDLITIDFKSSNTAKIQIIDYLGKTVISDEIQNGKKAIDLSHLSSGLYFIKVSDEQETFIRKIIKK
ncbi:T9SS type A sorting domain-containing protein [Formosa sp. PL04]|uniref:T9SS type A sorting domain-containing protein n=1 Tax=Formosa sp. PL04 TaxID=3081755 RepID=UPI002980C6F7|nr:T9SS type A sorting domain-containing protein [Formosa sp. PL04]MDW5290826.1 T9SS type A sorting domain-containing protein [Formosa sp. PL04]